MNRSIKLTTLGLISALTLAVAAPMTAQAGTMTIYNGNCTKTANWKTVKRVTVFVRTDADNRGCTNESVTIHKGHSKTVQLATKDSRGRDCGAYSYSAQGTKKRYDFGPYSYGAVNCKKNWLGVCKCTIDKG